MRAIELDLAGLVPGSGGVTVVRHFFSRALTPALTYEAPVPPGTQPLILKTAVAAWSTVELAVAACSVATVLGLALGFLASTAWWERQGPGLDITSAARPRRRAAFVLYLAARTTIAAMRSIHELIWAVLFLAALGFSRASAVLALAIPFSGTLAKVFSELVDEAPREPSAALRMSGANGVQAYLFGLVPRALPDLFAYSLYRFECALRSSVVLGFFGFPTLGYYFAVAFENLHYGEVWTYLYAVMALVFVVDRWGAGIRRRIVAP